MAELKRPVLGDLDVLPREVLALCLLFLEHEDRVAVELTCQGLLKLSRDTPLAMRMLWNNEAIMERSKYKSLMPRLLYGVLTERVPCKLNTAMVEVICLLSVTEYLCELIRYDFPNLRKVAVMDDPIKIADDESILWQFMDHSRCPGLSLAGKGFDIDMTSDLMTSRVIPKICERKCITRLRFGRGVFINAKSGWDFTHVLHLELADVHIDLAVLGVLIHPGLLTLDLDVERIVDDSEFDPMRLAFLDLPCVKDLSLRVREEHSSNEQWTSLIHTYSRTWKSLSELTLDVERIDIASLKRMIEGCSELPIQTLCLEIECVDHSLDEPHSPLLSELVQSRFKTLNKMDVDLMEVDKAAQDCCVSLIRDLFNVHESGVMAVTFRVNWDPITLESCLSKVDSSTVKRIQEWIEAYGLGGKVSEPELSETNSDDSDYFTLSD